MIVESLGKRGGSRKGSIGSEGITQTEKKTKKGECDYTDEGLTLLNHLKP